VLLHGKRSLFVEPAKSGSTRGIGSGTRAEEEEANTFAANILIPASAWETFVAGNDFEESAITAFAAELDIAPGIVVGRLQREKLLPYNRGTSLFRKLTWGKASAA
jgi:Zn-dependent peptidase ImmA (M78 family)